MMKPFLMEVLIIMAMYIKLGYSFLSTSTIRSHTLIPGLYLQPNVIRSWGKDFRIWSTPSNWTQTRLNPQEPYGFKESDTLKEIGDPNRRRIASRAMHWLITRVLEMRTTFVTGLKVHIYSKSNRRVMLGRVSALVIAFEKINFGQIWITGGGTFFFRGLELKMRRFLFQDLQSLRKPYELYMDLIFTQSDVVNSRFFRNVFQNLADTILRKTLQTLPQTKDLMRMEIKRVTTRARKIFVAGTADFASRAAIVPFEISLGAGVKGGGQVVYLRDIEVVFNPDSVLRTTVPIILTSPIDVDIGDSSRIDSLVISGQQVWLRAKVDITPLQQFAVVPVVSKAMYRYDISNVLSKFLRFRNRVFRLPGSQPPS
jgi:hypothetical protein